MHIKSIVFSILLLAASQSNSKAIAMDIGFPPWTPSTPTTFWDSYSHGNDGAFQASWQDSSSPISAGANFLLYEIVSYNLFGNGAQQISLQKSDAPAFGNYTPELFPISIAQLSLTGPGSFGLTGMLDPGWYQLNDLIPNGSTRGDITLKMTNLPDSGSTLMLLGGALGVLGLGARRKLFPTL